MPEKLELAGALGHLAADRRMDILRRVGEGGSISQAARDAGVSYKAAWQALDTLSNLAGAALVDRAVGGAGGGGARLTPAGQALLRAAGEMAAARQQVMTRLARRGATAPGLGALNLRTSMRNQLPCAVTALAGTGPLMRATLALVDGTTLHASLTRESAELLALAPGLAVIALCKATAVSVSRAVAGAVPRARTGRNRLAGRASRVARGETGDEVAVRLPGGAQLVGFAPAASGLRAGNAVWLAFDESAVALALAG